MQARCGRPAPSAPGHLVEDREGLAVDGHDGVTAVVEDVDRTDLAGRLAVIVGLGTRGLDELTADEPGRCGRRVGQDLGDADLPGRLREQGDEREDDARPARS